MKELKFNDLKKALKNGAKGYSIWIIDTQGVSAIYKIGALKYLTELGFYKKKIGADSFLFYRKVGHIITQYSPLEIREIVFESLFHEPLNYEVDFGASKITIEHEQLEEVFRRNQDNIFNHNNLTSLEELPFKIARDNKNEAFVPFKNTVVKITKENITALKYDELDNMVFYSTQIIERDFEYCSDWKDCMYASFIKNIADDIKERKDSLRSAIGYLLHRYNDVTTSQAVILYDEVMTGKSTPEGGTGKGVFVQAIRKLVKGFVPINGKSIKATSQFAYQQIKPDTSVVHIDDVSSKFDIDDLNSVLSEGLNVEKKFKDVMELPKEETPKFILSSNIILSYEGSTRERRQYILQISSFYRDKLKQGVAKPIVEEHGAEFFSEDWDKEEWNKFYSFMLNCIKYYLIHGLVKTPPLNFKKNAFIQKYGIDIYLYFEQLSFTSNQEYSTKEMYGQYIDYDESLEIKQRGFTNALKTYLEDNKIKYELMQKGGIKILL